jgi:hypothetical protein
MTKNGSGLETMCRSERACDCASQALVLARLQNIELSLSIMMLQYSHNSSAVCANHPQPIPFSQHTQQSHGIQAQNSLSSLTHSQIQNSIDTDNCGFLNPSGSLDLIDSHVFEDLGDGFAWKPTSDACE